MNRATHDDPESEVSKKRLVGSVGAALTVLALLLAMTISMNAVTAAFAPGIGGINATFEKLNYNNSGTLAHNGDAHIYPVTTPDTAACNGTTATSGSGNQVPVLTADIPGAVGVKGLFLKKTIPATGGVVSTLSGINNVTVNITAAQNSEITLSQPTLEFSGLDARWLNLSGGVAIYENYSNGTTAAPYFGSNGEFHVNATNLQMKGATAFAHLVAFQSIELPNQELSLEFNQPQPTANDVCSL